VPGVKALATASFAVTITYGIKDNDMTYEENFAAMAGIALVARRRNLPLTVDFQYGYFDDIAKSVTEIIKLGVIDANIEDSNDRTGKLRPKEESAQRIKMAATAASDPGVPVFVINARTDVIGEGVIVDQAIDCAKAFLDAKVVTALILVVRGTISRSKGCRSSVKP
jgi:2-methylisocitrate lyase-like PEP mutase family enzyme